MYNSVSCINQDWDIKILIFSVRQYHKTCIAMKVFLKQSDIYNGPAATCSNSQIRYHILLICGNKRPTRCNRLFLLQILLLAAAAARKPDTQPSAPHHTDNLKTKAPNTTGSNHLYNTLELLMMGITVPETCWASNKICNKNHLLHLVGILFPHINDDARSKPH